MFGNESQECKTMVRSIGSVFWPENSETQRSLDKLSGVSKGNDTKGRNTLSDPTKQVKIQIR